jgi:hypothetical protein
VSVLWSRTAPRPEPVQDILTIRRYADGDHLAVRELFVRTNLELTPAHMS